MRRESPVADPLAPDSEAPDPGLSVVDWMVQQRRAAGLSAVQGLDGSPDDAARAVQLGDATGADAGSIYSNLEDFERSHKAAIVNELVNSNSFLRGIAESHPLAPTLAQDDWGQLSKVGESIDQLQGKPQMDYTRGRLKPIIDAIDPGKQVDEAFPSAEVTRSKWIHDMPPGLAGFAQTASQYGLSGALGLDILNQVKEGLDVSWGSLKATATLASRGDILGAGFGLVQTAGALGQAASGAVGFNTALKLIGDEYELATGGIIPSEVTQNQLMAASMVLGMPKEAMVDVGMARRMMDQVHQVGVAVKPFIDAGITPPLGIHPVIDQMWTKQAEADLKNLADLQKEAAKSTLRERAPDIFEQAIDREITQNIGVKAEAVRKLYGDKQITAGDGLLGDAGNVAEQLILAEAHGGDVQIPMGKWLSRVDPEVQKALQDDIRIRTQAPTKNEIEEMAERTERLRQEEEQARTEAKVQPKQQTDWFSLSPEEQDRRLREADEQTQGEFRQVPYGVDKDWVRGLTYDEYQDVLAGKSQLKLVPSKMRDEIAQSITLAHTGIGSSVRIPLSPLSRGGLYGLHSIVPVNNTMETFKSLGKTYISTGSFRAEDGLARIQKDRFTDKTNPIPRAMLEFFGDRLQRLAGDIMVHVVPDAVMNQIDKDYGVVGYSSNAFYDPRHNHIVMRENVANGTGFGHAYTAGALTEEVAHAATFRELQREQRLNNRVTILRRAAIEWLKDNDQQSLIYHEYELFASVNGKFKEPSELAANAEFIAWAWKAESRFKDTLSKIPISPALRRMFGAERGLANLWDLFRNIIKNVLTLIGKKPPPESVLDAILRMGPEFERANAQTRQLKGEGPQLPGRALTPTTDPITQRIKAYGMNTKRAENYRKLVEKAQAEDAEWQLKQGEKRERRMQTAEWKENARQMREDVEADLKTRPDHVADRLLRLGEWQGQKVQRVGLDKAGLTPEQIAKLPEQYFKGASKVKADWLAQATGHATGDMLVDRLGQLHAAREAAGQKPAEYFKSLVDAETKRQMELVHGNLEENILADAQEHVLGASSLDVTHEELIALAEKAGVSIMDKDGIKAAAKAEFDKQLVENISREKYQAAAARHAQGVEDELAKGEKGDARKALQLKGQQVVALHLAGFAKKFEKELARDQRLRKALSRTEPTGIDPEYAIWAQDILTRTGTFVRRTVQGMERQKDLVSDSKSLRDFVDQVNSASNIWQTDPNSVVGYNLPMPDFLMDPGYRKNVDKMTVEEFRATALALRAINGIGRDIKSFTVKGEKRGVEEVRNGLIERMKAFYLNQKVDLDARHPMQFVGTWLLNPETWFNKLDLFNPNGPFNQLLIRPVVEGSYESLALRKQMAKEWKELATFTEPNKKIQNPLFKESDGDAREFTKEQAYVVLANMGNDLQRKKLAAGYGIKDVQDIWNWLGSVLTKEDMERQQKMGEFWQRWFGKSEEMYAKLRGWIPDRIELGTVQTPWGVYPEWYHPLIPDPIRHTGGLRVADILDESGYYRPAPPSGYTKTRTGAIYPIDLSFRGVVGRAEQIANDIAMRPPITEVTKILLDKKFKDAMTRYMGPNYQKAIEPWLRDSAGQRLPGTDATIERIMNGFRQNLSTLLIGLNPGTFFKHTPTALAFSMREVGAQAFLDSFLHMFHETDTGQSRWRFAFEHSQELPNRLHFARESIGAVNEDVFKKINWDSKFFRARDIIQTIGALPVAMGDLASAVPMWDAKYRQLRAEGAEHGDAVYAADTVVRRTHGSTIIANRPTMLRKGGLWAFLTPFYNFFNNALQRNYEYGWQAKLALKGRTLPEMTGFEKEEYAKGMSHLPTILGGFITFAIIPSLIEQVVEPLPQKKGESTLWHWSKVLTHAPVSMIPLVRDFVGSLIQGREVSAGILGTGLNDVAKPMQVNWVKNPDKGLRNSMDAIGALTGLTYHTEANLVEYMWNLQHGKEKKPSGMVIPDVVSILRHGTLREQKR